jgi:hypothetical protein
LTKISSNQIWLAIAWIFEKAKVFESIAFLQMAVSVSGSSCLTEDGHPFPDMLPFDIFGKLHVLENLTIALEILLIEKCNR